MDAVTATRCYFLLTASATLVIFAVPPLSSRFLAYGARSSQTAQSKRRDDPSNQEHAPLISRILDHLASYTVPHSWFAHFYLLGLALFSLWCYAVPEARTAAACILAVHHLRRLLETLMLSHSSTSRIHVAHWLMGLGFYVALSIAIWIEDELPHSQLQSSNILLGSSIFLLASIAQNSYHRHLARLPRAPNYQLPTHPFFARTITPHYLAECVEYLGLSILAAPQGRYANVTVLCAAVFVLANLGVTAHGTRIWYISRFGAQRIGDKARMIPGIW